MPINSDKPHLWKADVAQSIDFYNDWFLRFAPDTYRKQRVIRTKEVLAAFEKTGNLSQITPQVLKESPGILPILRMVTAPPLARDRLIGLTHLNKAMVGAMEGNEERPPRLRRGKRSHLWYDRGQDLKYQFFFPNEQVPSGPCLQTVEGSAGHLTSSSPARSSWRWTR